MRRADRSSATIMEVELASKTDELPLTVTVKHAGLEKTITGTPQAVLRELTSYFSEIYPALEMVTKLTLSIDDSEFLESCSGILASSPEGLAILKDVEGLRDKDLIVLHLAGSRLLHLLKRREGDAMSLEELTRMTGRSTGTVAGRMNELNKDQLIERVGKGEYRLTTMGGRAFMKTLIPKLAEFPDR